MKTLADVLGITNAPFAVDVTPLDTEDVNPTAQQFALSILESAEYRQSILRRITLDELPAAVETKLMDYGWGKPKETIQHNLTVTKVVREIVDPVESVAEEDAQPSSSVH